MAFAVGVLAACLSLCVLLLLRDLVDLDRVRCVE